MKAKINKALDLNLLFNNHRKGKLLRKQPSFPMMSSIKYDGNYVVVEVRGGKPIFTTSGGLTYIHTDAGGKIFTQVPDAVYLAERVWGEGKLGDRNRCNLRGPKTDQTSAGHTYKVFDILTLEEYGNGVAISEYAKRYKRLSNLFKALDEPQYLAGCKLVGSLAELDAELNRVTEAGFEGLMACQPCWCWEATTSRTIDTMKYKRRPTVDLLCVGCNPGEGKYAGLIGSLTLVDSVGRLVDVGSGLSDAQRNEAVGHFIGKVIEMGYEQIVDTYIQPTFVRVRLDKDKGGID